MIVTFTVCITKKNPVTGYFFYRAGENPYPFAMLEQLMLLLENYIDYFEIRKQRGDLHISGKADLLNLTNGPDELCIWDEQKKTAEVTEMFFIDIKSRSKESLMGELRLSDNKTAPTWEFHSSEELISLMRGVLHPDTNTLEN